MAEPVYTLEEARQFVVHAKNNRPTFNSIKTFQNAVLKALHKLNDPDLWHQHRTDRGFVTRSFMERVFPAMPESHCKRLVFPNADSSHVEALPLIDPSYTAKVVELAAQREMERNLEKELAEIYLTIDAIDLSSDPFPVDLGEAARWLGYSGEYRKAKASAKEALMKLGYKEYSDYRRRNIPTPVPQGGYSTSEEIRLAAECFKDFCLQSGAKRGPLIRKYFMEAEQRFRALTKSDAIQVSTNPDDLENVVRRVVRNEAEQQLTAAVGEIGENLGSVEVKVLTVLEIMQQQNATWMQQQMEQIESLRLEVTKSQTPAVADLKRLHGKLYQDVLEQAYRYQDGIHCPCCNKATTTWEIDHWRSKADPARTNGWKVCRSCNQALGAAGDSTKRDKYKNRFDAFQMRCDDYEQYLNGDEVKQLGLL